MSDISLSIVIPAYNEAGRIGPTLEAVRRYALGQGQPCEAVVVDDGSTDGTADVVRAFDPGPLAVQMLSSPENLGKGHAVRIGMLAAAGERLLLSDADLSTPIDEVVKLHDWLERGYDVVIGSRDRPESRLDPPQPWRRRLPAWCFRALRRRLLLPELRDTQCGFKLFRREAAREIFTRQTIDGWLFDCEVLALADRLGYRIKEVGVTWRHHPHSRVSVWRTTFTALPTLLFIRRRVRSV